MYVVEAQKPAVDEFSVAYHFIGEQNEVDAYKMNVGSLVLSSVELDILEVESAYRLIRNLSGGNSVSEGERETYETVVLDYNVLRNERMRTLIRGASRAAMSTSQLWEEYKSLDNFDPRDTDESIWLNRDGLGLTLGSDDAEDTTIEVQLIEGLDEIRGDYGPDSEEYKQADSLGLNAAAYQYELVYGGVLGREPAILSPVVHKTLGNVSAEGNFTPVVTVLHEAHPAVAKL